MNRFIVAVGCLWLASCSRPAEGPGTLTVAAASNLTGVFDQVAAAFEKQTGTHVVLSYGSTAQLATQIENGAPFDVFAAADTQHIDQLLEKGRIAAGTRSLYARGQLALWIPDDENLGVATLKDLTRAQVKFIAVAQPTAAPYGEAAVEAMKASGLWDALEPKLVYASNIGMARQFAATGNANAAFTAYSLVLKDSGTIVKIDPALYKPIDQAAGVVAASKNAAQARQFLAFLTGAEGKKILGIYGYLFP